MTTFEDGPAQGQTLKLHRAPYFLRVTLDGNQFDALDLLNDSPRLAEAIFVYRVSAVPGAIHLNTGRKPGGGFYTLATYHLFERQPSDEVMRNSDLWEEWCHSMPAELERWQKMIGDL